MIKSPVLSMRTRTLPVISASDIPAAGRLYFASEGTEDRSVLHAWSERAARVPDECIAISAQGPDTSTFQIGSERAASLSLRDDNALAELFDGCDDAYIDISGLAHTVWAPLLKAAWTRVARISVIYAEPRSYRRHPSPTSSSAFDLTDGFSGVGPLPGFAKLRGPEDEANTIFVPLLGFEGVRAKQVAQTLDPAPRTIPIVGVPGFLIEYPQHTVSSNRDFLMDSRSSGSARYVRADCPFEAWSALDELKREFGCYMYVAPVGTKPHALGAVAFALSNADAVELMYDHPIRKPKRTVGVGVTHIYRIKEP